MRISCGCTATEVLIDDGDVSRLIAASATGVDRQLSSRLRREEQAEAEEGWWLENSGVIEETFLIAHTGVSQPEPCSCGEVLETTIVVMSLESK